MSSINHARRDHYGSGTRRIEPRGGRAMGRLAREFTSLEELCDDIFERTLLPNKTASNILSQQIKRSYSCNDALKAVSRTNCGFDKRMLSTLLLNTNITLYEAKRVLDYAPDTICDVVTYDIIINKAAENNDYHTAKTFFEKAMYLDIDDPTIHNSFIYAAGKTGYFNGAQYAFNRAVSLDLANRVTYSSFIQAAGKTNNFDEAQYAFNEAVRVHKANRITISIFMDVLTQKASNFEPTSDAAKKLCEQAEELFYQIYDDIPKTRHHSIPQIDLHGFSHGIGKVLCSLIDQGKIYPDKPKMVLITGKGSKENSNYLLFSKTLIDFITNSCSTLLARRDEGNAGELIINRVKLDFVHLPNTLSSSN